MTQATTKKATFQLGIEGLIPGFGPGGGGGGLKRGILLRRFLVRVPGFLKRP